MFEVISYDFIRDFRSMASAILNEIILFRSKDVMDYSYYLVWTFSITEF